MAEYKGGNKLKKNPDDAARNWNPVMYTKSLEGGPPATEYAKKSPTKSEGPNQVIPNQKAPRNPK